MYSITGLALLCSVGNEFVDHFPVQLVVGADGDFVQIAQHVQLGQGDVGRGLHLNAVAGGNKVDGADPAGTAGLRAVLEARLPEGVRFGTEHLTDEGAFAHAGGVGFHNADDLVDLGGGQTGTHRSVGGNGIGRGGVGVDAVVQIPQRAQLGFKQDLLPSACALRRYTPVSQMKGLIFSQ